MKAVLSILGLAVLHFIAFMVAFLYGFGLSEAHVGGARETTEEMIVFGAYRVLSFPALPMVTVLVNYVNAKTWEWVVIGFGSLIWGAALYGLMSLGWRMFACRARRERSTALPK